mgnify:CR=1 FL=1
MFDFVSSTYSGVLSVLSTLFGMSYPLVIGCIERIDSKFRSTKLSERFLSKVSFKYFRYTLVINLIIGVLSPFLMASWQHARFFIIVIQCVGAIVSVLYVFILFSKIMSYYTIADLQREILTDYKKAVQKNDKTKEAEYFTQWVDLSGELLKSADETLVQSVYETLSGYVIKKYANFRDKILVFDPYYYDGVSRINEFLSKGESKPISVNNGNSILTSLIWMDSIVSETTYRYLWRNLRIQMFYNKDEWIMEYWKIASQKIRPFMKPIHQNGLPYTTEQIEECERLRGDFVEFHIMLCAMLIQEKKYQLLELMLSFTQSEPPSYPLIPSTLREIIAIFNRINQNSFTNPFYYESKYQMPNMYGITEGKIVGAANCYLALLAYRIYVIRWDYNSYLSVLSTGTLPSTLSELETLKNNLGVFKQWLMKIAENKDLLNVINFQSFDKEIKEKARIYGYQEAALLKPDKLLSNMEKEILTKMEELRSTLPLSNRKVASEEKELTDNILRVIEPYSPLLLDRLDRRFSQGKSYNLNSSVKIPFRNTAFVENPDVEHINIAGSMSSYMLQNFQYLFARSFYQEYTDAGYNLSSEDLFEGIDKLELNEEHYIIAFGIYLDYYIDRVTDLQKKKDHYTYKGVKILLLDCSTEYFSQMLYVMRYDDRPFLTFQEPSEEEIKKLYLHKADKSYNLWLSIQKIQDHPELLEEPIKAQLGGNAKQYSLFSAIWMPKLSFNSERHPAVYIKVKYRLTNEGSYDSVDKVKPFPKEASPNN